MNIYLRASEPDKEIYWTDCNKVSHYLANMGREVPEIKMPLLPWGF